MAESEKLPPSLGALKQHILRARDQARVWGQAAVPQQELLDPLENGYHRDSDDGQLKPDIGFSFTVRRSVSLDAAVNI